MNHAEPQILVDNSRLQEIYDLRVHAWEKSERSHLVNRRYFPYGWKDELDEGAIHYFFEDKDRIVASARLHVFNSIDEFPLKEIFNQFSLPTEFPFGFYSRLVVDPDYRNLSLSTKLDKARQSYLKDIDAKFSLVISGNANRIDFFVKNGWKVLGEVSLRFHPDSPQAEHEYALIYTSTEEISIWGRNLVDYKKMFSLTATDMTREILGVADGPASFNCEMHNFGYNVTSVDPIFSLSKSEVGQKIADSTEKLTDKLKNRKLLFKMQNEQETDMVIASRVNAMKLFIEDFERGRNDNRYIGGALPVLPFAGSSFDLCLCANLLFLFEEFFTWETHISSIREMLRVSREVRIFPIYNRQGKTSRYFERTIESLSSEYKIELVTVDYEVYVNGNKMLRIVPSISK